MDIELELDNLTKRINNSSTIEEPTNEILIHLIEIIDAIYKEQKQTNKGLSNAVHEASMFHQKF